MRVAILGIGAIGAEVAKGMRDGVTPGAEFAGVISRTPGKAEAMGFPEISFEDALAECDLIVECAGGEAVRQHGPAVIAAGKDLLAVSIGAIADPQLRKTLCEDGPGRTVLSTGAIGGLDVLAAASTGGGLEQVTLTSRKLPGSIVQPWMSEDEAHQLRTTTTPVTVFEGPVTEAIEKFPKSLNIAVALAQATGLWENTIVRLIGDPEANLTRHEVEGHGASGEYSFTMLNHPLPSNPASSSVVAQALLKGTNALSNLSGRFV